MHERILLQWIDASAKPFLQKHALDWLITLENEGNEACSCSRPPRQAREP
jgi:hypothetical protein